MQKDARAYYANMKFPNSILQIHSVILVIARPPISSLHPFLAHSICGRLFCQFNVVFMDFLLVHTPSTDVSLQLHLEAENDESEHHSWRKTCFSFRCNSVLYKECPRGIFSSVHHQNVLTRYLSRPAQSKYLVSKYSRQSAKSYQQKKKDYAMLFSCFFLLLSLLKCRARRLRRDRASVSRSLALGLRRGPPNV
jgi:hypothetical protein